MSALAEPTLLDISEALYARLATFLQAVPDERLETALDIDDLLLQLKFWQLEIETCAGGRVFTLEDEDIESTLHSCFTDAAELLERLEEATKHNAESQYINLRLWQTLDADLLIGFCHTRRICRLLYSVPRIYWMRL